MHRAVTFALSNRAPSGQEVLHNSWIGYLRVRGKDVCAASAWKGTFAARVSHIGSLQKLRCELVPVTVQEVSKTHEMLNNGAFNAKQDSYFISQVSFEKSWARWTWQRRKKSYIFSARCGSDCAIYVMGKDHFSLPHETCMNDLTLSLSQLFTFTVLPLSVSHRIIVRCAEG